MNFGGSKKVAVPVAVLVVAVAGALFAGIRLAKGFDVSSMGQYTSLIRKIDAALDTVSKKAAMQRREPLNLEAVPAIVDVDAAAEGVLLGIGDLNLNGIIWNDQQPLALINDTLVAVGDVIGGARIMDIQKENVTYTNSEGKTETLKMYNK